MDEVSYHQKWTAVQTGYRSKNIFGVGRTFSLNKIIFLINNVIRLAYLIRGNKKNRIKTHILCKWEILNR